MRRHLTRLVVSILVGVLASSFYAIAQWPRGFFATVFIGGVIGAVIYIFVAAEEVFLLARVVNPRARSTLRVVMGVLAGALGTIVGLVAGVALLGGNLTFSDVLTGRGRPFILIATAITAAVGAVIHSYDLLQNRLRTAMNRIKEQEWAERELEMARLVQTRLLPPPVTKGEGYVVAARNLAASLVAGDFYDVVPLDDGSIVLVVADVAGKGMAASLTMASVKAVLPFLAREGVVKAMELLNAKLVGELARREFVALLFARFTPSTGSLEIANAGCPDPYLVTRRGVEAVIAPGMRLPLGVRRDAAYATVTRQLAPGDRALFVTDGIPEAPTADGEPFGYDRLCSLVDSLRAEDAHAEAWLDRFLDEVRSSVVSGYNDDWTAMVLEFGGASRAKRAVMPSPTAS